MSLMNELNSDDAPKHSTSGGDLLQDHVVNLSEFEKPVGKLSISPDEISIDGKSLNEMKEDAKRVRNTPTAFDVGSEIFNIHHRRYHDGDSCHPQRAALEARSFIIKMMENTELMNRVNDAAGKVKHNPDLPDHQVIGTMLIGILNMFYRASGVTIVVNKKTIDPEQLLLLNKMVVSGQVDATKDPNFKVLTTVEELDASTSLAMDTFIGMVFGTPGLNGVVESQLDLFAKHLTDLALTLLESMEDANAYQTLLSVMNEPRWANDKLGLSVYLSDIDFYGKLSHYDQRLKKRLGGLSIKLVNTLVDMSLWSVPLDDGAFGLGGRPKKFLSTSATRFNELFSNYAIVLAATIRGSYPLESTVRGPAKEVFISYIEHRIHYDALITNMEINDDYIQQRLESRVIHHTLSNYWKNDTAHSRLLRHAIGTYQPRHMGSIEIILSMAERTSNVIVGDSINWRQLNKGTLGQEEPTNPATTEKETPIQEEKGNNDMAHLFSGIRAAGKMMTLNGSELSNNFGSPIDIVRLGGDKTLMRLGMAGVMAVRKDDTTIIVEPSSNRELGHIVNNNIVWKDDAIAQYYLTLTQFNPETVHEVEDTGATAECGFTPDVSIRTSIFSGLLPHESKTTIARAIKVALHDSAPARYNNVWENVDLSHTKIEDSRVVIKVEGETIGMGGTGKTKYPAQYYTGQQGALNWLRMVNTAGTTYKLLDDIDLAPNMVLTLDRLLPNGLNMNIVKVMDIGNLEVMVIPNHILIEVGKALDITYGATVSTADTEVAVFNYIGKDNQILTYATPLLFPKAEPTPETPSKLTTDGPVEASALFGAVEDNIPSTESLFGDEEIKTIVSDEVVLEPRDTSVRGSLMDEFDTIGGAAEDTLTGSLMEVETKTEVKEVAQPEKVEVEELDAMKQHQVDMEALLDEVITDEGDIIEAAVVEPIEGEVKPKKLQGLSEISKLGLDLISYYGTHRDELFSDEEQLAKAREYYQGNPDSHRAARAVALNRYLPLPEGHTVDMLLEGFAEDNMGEISYTKVNLEGGLALEVESTDETAPKFIELMRKLGISAVAGVDTIEGTNHRWLVMVRYNEVMDAGIIHIVDAYDAPTNVFPAATTLPAEDTEELHPQDILEITDEMMPDEFPVLAEKVRITPDNLINMTDTTRAVIANAGRQADVIVKGAEFGNKLKPVEVLTILADSKDIPRRLVRALTTEVANRVRSITSAHHPLNYTLVPLRGINDIATFVAEASTGIHEAFGNAALHAYINEINSIDLTEPKMGSLLMVDIDAASLGMDESMAMVPTTSLMIDFEADMIDDEDFYVLTNDAILMKYQPADEYHRSLLVRQSL